MNELERLFQSFLAQDYGDFQVIVVDQNLDGRLDRLIASYQAYFPILHLRESKRGQSRARNIGFKHVQGDIVAFPDDDCLYPEGVLRSASLFFQENPSLDGLIARVYDLDEEKNAFPGVGNDQSREVDYAKAYKDGISCGIFFRAPIAEKIRFDETLGPGAGTPWACSDEADFLHQCLDAGYRFYYDATLIVRHPNPLKENGFLKQIRREYAYGVGNGYFLATHYLPQAFLKSERSASYKQASREIFKGNLRRASYALAKGMGVSRGYRAGLKRPEEIQKTVAYAE
ncbi:MAG: glycosyltransferase [Phaeodactylibacter sp.]|nr:glycosyltransferase [Phaeodactylibacter sp.]